MRNVVFKNFFFSERKQQRCNWIRNKLKIEKRNSIEVRNSHDFRHFENECIFLKSRDCTKHGVINSGETQQTLIIFTSWSWFMSSLVSHVEIMIWRNGKGCLNFEDLFPETHSSCLIFRRASDTLRLRDILKNICQYHEEQGNSETLSQCKGD